MKNLCKSLQVLFCASALGLGCASLQATVLVNDTFSDGLRSGRSAEQLDSGALNWYTSNSNGNRLSSTTGSMTLNDASVHAVGQFSRHSLSIGQEMILSFDLAIQGTLANGQSAMRFGLFDSMGQPQNQQFLKDGDNPNNVTSTGYMTRYDTGRGRYEIHQRKGTGVLITASSVYDPPLSTNGGFELDKLEAGVTYTAQLIIRYLDHDLVEVETRYLTGTSETPLAVFSQLFSGSVVTSFDTIAFANLNASVNEFKISNVKVEVIPEPSSASLALIGASVFGFLLLRARVARR